MAKHHAIQNFFARAERRLGFSGAGNLHFELSNGRITPELRQLVRKVVAEPKSAG